MNRRHFLAITSAGFIAGATSGSKGVEGMDKRKSLPEERTGAIPSLGSHWDGVFKKLSAGCKPRFSFLNDEFDDPKSWGRAARKRLLDHLHYSPPACDPGPEVLGKADCATHIREHIVINTTPDIRVPLYCLVPKGLKGPAPAILAYHDHGAFYYWGKEKLVHVEPEHPVLTAYKKGGYGGRSIADELARRGFVVIVPDLLHWGERGMYFENDPERIRKRTPAVTEADVKEFNERSWRHEELISRTALTCGATWAGINIWDDLRVTDYLLSRPEVDSRRVGCIGHSMGGFRSIYSGALHPAVRASVAAGWMAEYQPMAERDVGHAIGYTKLIPGLYQELDWPDLAGLHWPGALMTISGDKDTLAPFEAVRGAISKIQRIFAKMGCSQKYEGVVFEGPHELNVVMQERAFDWLGKQLIDV